MKTTTLGFIGGGRITRILLQAFENATVSLDSIAVFDTNQNALAKLKEMFPQLQTTDRIEEVVKSDLVILAIHPPVVMETLEKIKKQLSAASVFLSLTPKFNIEKLENILGMNNIARMNPSASTIVNKGVNPISFSSTFDDNKKQMLLDLVKALGYIPEVDDSKIEAYAVISAMGHTYFNFQLQKLKELAVSFGMDEDEAKIAITNMLWGTTETLFRSNLTFAEVDDLVPVKPLSEVEETIKGYYDQYLNAIFNKIKPQ
ncbi:MAG TPA: NAD(P)-binding domain-containing protein [Prolixibacteraceae bacterium]|nr:NAD(P)-binding domain-containing protein [Prolixibacteraceae bacterium]HPS13053.1 NAD(P)-binding domain-containing protein [Prolixibacteraceae bacterium]